MNQAQHNHRDTTGSNRRVRVETWLDKSQVLWLKGLSIQEDRSMSSVLRRALRAYIKQSIREQKAAAGSHRG